MFFIPFLDCFCYCWVTDNGNCLCRVGGKIASCHTYAFFVTLLIMLLGNSLINVITFGTPCLVLVFFVSHCQLLWKSLHSGLLLWTHFHFQWFLFSAMLVWQNLRRDYCSVMCVCVYVFLAFSYKSCLRVWWSKPYKIWNTKLPSLSNLMRLWFD